MPGAHKKEMRSFEIPYIQGGFQLLIDPTATAEKYSLLPNASGEKTKWFINDHCFVTDSQGELHIFGIHDPYPRDGKLLYTLHPYLAHYVCEPGSLKFRYVGMALNDSEGTRYLGAPYVIAFRGKYLMLFESILEGHRALELAVSGDLYTWKRMGQPILEDLNETKRDPCILQDGERYCIYLCNPQKDGSSVEFVETRDFEHFTHRTCLYIPDGTDYGGIESPFVVKRGDRYYLFFTYAHRHYYETVVLVSEQEDHFDMANQVTTLHGHASELFHFGGREYITSCGPEDWQDLNLHGLEAARLEWIPSSSE